MLDLKAKLAAAGIVTKEQVEDFDEKQAKEKRAREEKRKQRERAPSSKNRGSKPGQSSSAKHRNKGRPKKTVKKDDDYDYDSLKKLGKGEAYQRIRKIVEHSRLDDKEQTIPGPDDQVFNFVTATGSIGRLYLRKETAKSVSEGKSGISSFMSHHGLSHCVLPSEVALGIAKVFPIWLRQLQGHPDAGRVWSEAEQEELAKSKKRPAKAAAEEEKEIVG